VVSSSISTSTFNASFLILFFIFFIIINFFVCIQKLSIFNQENGLKWLTTSPKMKCCRESEFDFWL
jgi:Fe2+ transport system protein B